MFPYSLVRSLRKTWLTVSCMSFQAGFWDAGWHLRLPWAVCRLESWGGGED